MAALNHTTVSTVSTVRYESVEQITKSLLGIVKPPERLTVSQTATKYRRLNNLGAYVGPWLNSKVPYMVEPMDTLDSPHFDGVVFVGPAQSGKPLWVETKVPTPDGWKRLGDVVAGDVVFSEHGQPAQVVYGTEVFTERNCYRITFDDGSEIIADGVHRWSVNDMWAKDPYAPVVRDTNSMLDTYRVKTSKGSYRYRFSIPVASPLQLPNADLPLDPYILGLWLGDGHHNGSALTLGYQDHAEIIEQIERRGFHVRTSPGNSTGSCVRVVVIRNDGVTMHSLLRDLGLCLNKQIPSAYLRASEYQRRELLRGLMDTDGTVADNGRILISQSRPELFDQVRELVVSLGYKAMCDVKATTYSHKGQTLSGADSYRLAFCTEDATGCFTLDRQLSRHKAHLAKRKTRPTHSGRRFIRSIEPVETVPVRCISVASDTHLFLVGDQMVPTHNTDALIINWAAHSIRTDPMDMLVFCPTSAAARDFSLRRVDRLLMHSPEVGGQLKGGRDNDNRLDKRFSSGAILTLSHPSKTEMAGRPVPRVALTDYDRMPMDVDGEGSPYDLAAKRTTTFGSYAMCLAESSPSFPIEDPRWLASTPHEAPPTQGILALYNRGDRRRYYAPCPHCNQFFEAEFEHLHWDESLPTVLAQAESVYMVCPRSGCIIRQNERTEMFQWGVWLKDGQGFDEHGRVIGDGARTPIASFWLKGVAAAFTTWTKLVATYLAALREYEMTGSEEALQKFYNTDLAQPYIPKSLESERTPEQLRARAEPLPEKQVPDDVRFLIATVDVQKNAFVVQVQGISPGTPFDVTLIDRFTILKSNRLDDDGERIWVKPATFAEDWDLIVEQVMSASYPLADGSGRRMAVKLTLCDSGGKAGVTAKAYDFYRSLRQRNLHGKFHLVKGDGKPNAPRTRISFPDAQTKDRSAAARGDVPVLMFNSNILKDTLNGRLDCITPGKGLIRFPDWLPDWFYVELCGERRTNKGWEKLNGVRNEAWDLLYYCIGACASKLLLVEGFDWNNPPAWAQTWEKNILISEPDEPTRFAAQVQTSYDFSKFAEALA